MTALGTPPAHRSGSGAKRALTRKQIAAVLREQFPKVSRSQCEKAASEAVAYCHVRPDADAMEHAVTVLLRNSRQVSYRNRRDADVGRANSTVLDAIANLQAGVA